MITIFLFPPHCRCFSTWRMSSRNCLRTKGPLETGERVNAAYFEKEINDHLSGFKTTLEQLLSDQFVVSYESTDTGPQPVTVWKTSHGALHPWWTPIHMKSKMPITVCCLCHHQRSLGGRTGVHQWDSRTQGRLNVGDISQHNRPSVIMKTPRCA